MKKFFSRFALLISILCSSALMTAGIALADRTPVVASPTTIANGGTNATSQVTNGINFYNGTRITSNANFIFNGTNTGIGSSSPNGKLSVLARNGETNPFIFIVASSTASATTTALSTTNGGQTSTCEAAIATSTSIALNFANTCNQVLIQTGTAGVTITVSGAKNGDTKRIIVVNPNAVAGTITWAGVNWIGGTAPTQTTTANGGDLYSCFATQATSTAATSVKVECAAATGLQ